ncbi:MAG TPA: cobalt-precorrin-5B (C(1))-methyltransferase [bacterium]|jgi:cobalt-precorrin-5B (C1)-methyltransferase|nr:cobalt-precorrin-5B (C(1))-methyltransferase [bacterium]
MEAKPKGTRTGFTTGANATACTVAALLCLLDSKERTAVRITLPEGQTPEFAIAWTRRGPDGSVTCAAVKDGGDDPDATHGAEIRATVSLNHLPGQVRFLKGEGVGTVTKPGLGLEVGGPAVNPVPRRMMSEHGLGILRDFGLDQEGLDISVSVKDGEAIARKTLNARLGILGGISILGRSGIVYPYSTAAYVASVEQGIEVAVHQGCDTVVLTTGGLTEQFAMELMKDLPEAAFVQMGDYVGKALDHCVKLGVKRAILAGQMGKVAKLAQGEVHTHARKSAVDLALLADLARSSGAPEGTAALIAAGTTARYAYELGKDQPWLPAFLDSLCGRAAQVAKDHVQAQGGSVEVESWLLDFEKAVRIGWAVR